VLGFNIQCATFQVCFVCSLLSCMAIGSSAWIAPCVQSRSKFGGCGVGELSRFVQKLSSAANSNALWLCAVNSWDYSVTVTWFATNLGPLSLTQPASIVLPAIAGRDLVSCSRTHLRTELICLDFVASRRTFRMRCKSPRRPRCPASLRNPRTRSRWVVLRFRSGPCVLCALRGATRRMVLSAGVLLGSVAGRQRRKHWRR
jgi:hypothetical protein